MKAQVDIQLHIDNFRNIDLHYQGLYQAKFRVYYLQNTENLMDTNLTIVDPYFYFQTDRQNERNKKFKSMQDSHALIHPKIQEEQSTFISKTFLIRYSDEIVEINDVVQFRTELDIEPEFLQTQFYIECALHFNDLSQFGGPSGWKSNLNKYQDCQFKLVETRTFKIKNAVTGFYEFLPLTFSNKFFSVLNIQVQSVLIDFKFRKESISECLFGKENPEKVKAQKILNYYMKILTEITNKLQKQHKQLLNIQECEQAGGLIEMLDTENKADDIAQKLSQASAKNVILLHQIIEGLRQNSSQISEILYLKYNKKIQSIVEESIVRQVIETNNFAFSQDYKIQEQHKEHGKLLRLSMQNAQELYQKTTNILNVESQQRPFIFEECYCVDPQISLQVKQNTKIICEKSQGSHLFVLVHGFHGNSNDLRLFKNQILLRHPSSLVLLSSVNEGNDSTIDIMKMGGRLSKEVQAYIKQFCPQVEKISFVTFSLGGLIARAAFPHLQILQKKFYSLISLGCPHLGYMYNSSNLIDTGIWFMKSFNKSEALTQLTMSDSHNPQETCLYKLSTLPGLAWFENIVLVCSNQDQYVPFDSARIQICKKALFDQRLGNSYIQMTQNLLKNLKAKLLYRIDVDFQIENKTIDNWIGRTAHIKLVQSESFIEMLITRYKDFFQ